MQPTIPKSKEACSLKSDLIYNILIVKGSVATLKAFRSLDGSNPELASIEPDIYIPSNGGIAPDTTGGQIPKTYPVNLNYKLDGSGHWPQFASIEVMSASFPELIFEHLYQGSLTPYRKSSVVFQSGVCLKADYCWG